MAVKTEFTKVDFAEILSNYDLGELIGFKPFTTGAIQTNYLLQAEKGKFVFRYYESRSRESVLFESEVIQFLRSKKYPCPAVFESNKNQVVGEFKGKPYIVFEFVEGEHIEKPSEEQKRQLVEKVAELHNITVGYKPAYTEFRWNYDVGLCGRLARDEAGKLGTANAMKKLKWLNGKLAKLILPESLPMGVCHCDFHFSNVLFKDGRFNALIDFDDANYTYLIYDLAALINPFVSSFEWNTWMKFKKSENVFDFREARWTVLEYMKFRPLNNDEKKYLYDVFKLSILLDCIWRFERGNADDFYERRKIDYLNSLGREKFFGELFN